VHGDWWQLQHKTHTPMLLLGSQSQQPQSTQISRLLSVFYQLQPLVQGSLTCM